MSDYHSRRDLLLPKLPGPDDALRAAIEDYTRSLIALAKAPRTILERRSQLCELASWLRGEGITSPAEVTLRDLENYRYFLHTQPIRTGLQRAVSTQVLRLVSARMFFRFMARTGQVTSDPARYLELPPVIPPLPSKPLTMTQVERIFAQPNLDTLLGIRDRALLEVLFATGIRRAELAHLTFDDVDAERRTLTVRRGKGGRSRMVPISERALAWIDSYLAVRPLAASDEDANALFLTHRGTAMGLINMSHTVRKYMEAAGIRRMKPCHSFRTTAASLLLENGADVRYVQEFLGHAKIETTQRYTAVSLGMLHRVYARTHPSATKPELPEFISIQGRPYRLTSKTTPEQSTADTPKE